MKSADRVDIAWIDPGLVDGAFALSMIELLRARPRIDTVIRIEGGLLSRQRNEAVTAFLNNSTSPWLLMIDSDETMPVASFDKLIGDAHEELRPVIGGLYFGTWPGGLIPQPIPHLYVQHEDGLGVVPVLEYPPNQLIRVAAVGTGCLLVHRRVLEAIRDDADEHEGTEWCWFRDLPVDGKWVGEDIYFCRRIQQLGFPIHAHTGAILAHRRKYWLDDQQFEAVRGRAGIPRGVAHMTEPAPPPVEPKQRRDAPTPAAAEPKPKRTTADQRPLAKR